MKNDNRRYLDNLVEYAKTVYLRIYDAAINGDFCCRKKLEKLDAKVYKWYSKYKKRPKKCFKLLIYAGALIYNHEIIVSSRLSSDLSILVAIAENRLYNPDKFKNFHLNGGALSLVKKGVRYSSIAECIDNIFRGV